MEPKPDVATHVVEVDGKSVVVAEIKPSHGVRFLSAAFPTTETSCSIGVWMPWPTPSWPGSAGSAGRRPVRGAEDVVLAGGKSCHAGALVRRMSPDRQPVRA